MTDMLRDSFEEIGEVSHELAHTSGERDGIADKLLPIMSLTAGDVFGPSVTLRTLAGNVTKKARLSIQKSSASAGGAVPRGAKVQVDVDNLKTLAHVIVGTKREANQVKTEAEQMKLTAQSLISRMDATHSLLEDCQTDLGRMIQESFRSTS